MPSRTLKKAFAELFNRLRASARRHRRSMTNDLIVQLKSDPCDPLAKSEHDVFAQLASSDRTLREAGVYLTDDKLERMITDGRA